jgi:hypothetical protein
MKQVIAVALIAVLISLPSCAPNRAEWMRQVAEQQAKAATEPIGNPDQVRAGSRQASAVLTSLAANIAANPPKGQLQAAFGFSRDTSEVSSGLLAIAESKTDEKFTNAVFAMCDPVRKDAAPRVGGALLVIAGASSQARLQT